MNHLKSSLSKAPTANHRGPPVEMSVEEELRSSASRRVQEAAHIIAYREAIVVAGQGGNLSQRRNPFNSERDLGKDHQMTQKEKYFLGLFKKKKKKASEKKETQWDSLDEKDSARYFKLKHLFASKEADPYADTYTYKHENSYTWKQLLGSKTNPALAGAYTHNPATHSSGRSSSSSGT